MYIVGLKNNTAKTKAMIFEKGRHTHYDFNPNNVELEKVTSFKYLGMYSFKNWNWTRTQKNYHNMLPSPYITCSHFFDRLNTRLLKNVNYLIFLLEQF